MNEIQIIQQHLATERQHFAQVAGACATAVCTPAANRDDGFLRTCADYFAFALTRLQCKPGGDAQVKLEAARVADPGAAAGRWREFLEIFTAECRQRFDTIEALLERNLPVAQWRAIARIDADTIIAERERFGRVRAGSPVPP